MVSYRILRILFGTLSFSIVAEFRCAVEDSFGLEELLQVHLLLSFSRD